MTPLTAAPDFEPALDDLQEHLPYWWRSRDPTSTLYGILAAMGGPVDELAALWEQPYLDSVLTTASDTGLQRNFAFAWGLQQEQLPAFLNGLLPALQARAQENGTLPSVMLTLGTLLTDPVNDGGPVLTFARDGSGLTFPADGKGLPLYEYESPPSLPLQFPFDGSGLQFPDDGTGLLLVDTFQLNVLIDYPTWTITAQVPAWLAYDRAAFKRTLERLRPPEFFPIVLQDAYPPIPEFFVFIDGGDASTTLYPGQIDGGDVPTPPGAALDLGFPVP